ncbi:MAG: calcium-binding protein [Roseovarius sp.]
MAHLGQSFASFETFLNRDDVDAFYSVDLAALNSSGVTGTAVLAVNTEMDGSRYLNVAVVAENVEASVGHPMHIHGTFDDMGNPTDATTPGLAQDADQDGLVEVLEGVGSYGDVLLPLGSQPEADANGNLVFIQNYLLNDDSNFFSPVTGNDYTGEDLLPLELREIVLHGVNVPAGLGAGSSGEVDGTQDGYVPILPAAAGEIEEIDLAQALDILEDQAAIAADNITLGDGGETVSTGPGMDTVIGGAGDDSILGGSDDDMLSGMGGDDTLEGGSGADMLDGGDGSDTASYANASAGVTADIGGAVTGTGDAAGDTYISIENLEGSGFADRLWGDDGDNVEMGGGFSDRVYGRAGDDTLDGGSGNDAIYGNQGADMLTGGSGTDRFIFFSEADSTTSSTDRITDFTDGERIEISRIDGDVNTGGNQALDFVGTAAFSGTAGELRYSSDGTDTTVQADTDGDMVADFELVLTGDITLDEGDFLL